MNLLIQGSYKHLGHIISNTHTDDVDINEKRCVFIGQTNNVLCYFAKLSANVRLRLFSSYCISFFGSELWRLDNTCIDDICISWRKAIRRIWSLPYNTHSHLLPLLCICLAINDQFCDRFLNFVRRCLSEHSSKLSLVCTITFHGLMFSRSHSPIGHNFMYCMKRYCFNYIDFLHSEYSIARHCSSLVEPADVLNANFLEELICLRNGNSQFFWTVIFKLQWHYMYYWTDCIVLGNSSRYVLHQVRFRTLSFMFYFL